MHCHAVEELIGLGADVGVTISQQLVGKWKKEGVPCKLGKGAWMLWMLKMNNLCRLRMAPEAVQDSLFGLIHLAVRHISTHVDSDVLHKPLDSSKY